MLKAISRFFRQWAARATVWASPVESLALYDYANGKWEHLHTAVTSNKTQCQDLDAIGANRITHMRDEVLVLFVFCNGAYGGSGSMQVIYPCMSTVQGVLCQTHVNEPRMWERFFCDLYDFREAYADTAAKCRELADKLGFRAPEEV